MSIKVSVILPSYNVAEYIEQCVRSVMDQTLKEIEILCIDAGSTDGTLEKLEELARESTAVRLIHSDKKSYGYQMNLGIKEARGEYIGIVETDDYVDHDMFETLYNRAMVYDVDMIKGVMYDVYETPGGEDIEFTADYIPPQYLSDVVLKPDNELLVHDWDSNIWNGIYKRSFLIDHEIWFMETPGASFQDIPFQQMVLNEAGSVAYIHAHFYHYRKLRQGASTWNPNCVRFVSDAYRYLLEDVRIKDSHKKYIYMRMAMAFLFEFKKALCLSEYDVNKTKYPEEVDWYVTEIRKAIHEGWLRFEDLNDNVKDEVVPFLADIDSYVTRWQTQAEALYTFLEEVKKWINDKPLIVFGMGEYGQAVIRFLLRNGVKISGFADNQKNYYNSSFYGIEVKSASDATRNKNGYFMVANKKAGIQIKNQLIELGVSEDRIKVLDCTNKGLIDGLKKAPILPKK